MNEEGAEKFRNLMVPAGQREASVVTPANLPPSTRRPGRIVIFVSFFAVGLVPPFSTFFLQVLDTFGVQLAHLSPNSVVILAIFTHFCEMFILRAGGKRKGSDEVKVVGCCNFRLWEGLNELYIPQVLRSK